MYEGIKLRGPGGFEEGMGGGVGHGWMDGKVRRRWSKTVSSAAAYGGAQVDDFLWAEVHRPLTTPQLKNVLIVRDRAKKHYHVLIVIHNFQSI